jgi:uncharacterized integral membrane protein
MNHWPFIVGAYAVTILGTLGVLAASFLRMRKAERQADSLTRRD